MSLFQFAPIASHPNNPGFVTWQDGFSEEEINDIIKLCSSLPVEKAAVGDSENTEGIDNIRNSTISWLERTVESEWIYERLAYIARKLNAEFYNFDLYGFVEHMQFTVYDGSIEGHYTWHLDFSNTSVSPRKFSLVLQLSDPTEYEGGELQIYTEPEIKSVERKKGLVAAFPSWTLHKVTPVTSGIRKTLVVWVAGPQFK